MGAARKLQQEIDRTMKKVLEGLDSFDEIWDKVYDGDNVHQKEKLEGDLKKEIKKLQRHRDQIKTWIASNDVKDKTDLTEVRKRIERQMERFKECEKEMKCKAFSKEGLQQQPKVDPREKERQERIEWLNEQCAELSSRVEMNESEQEQLLAIARKKDPPARVKVLTEQNARHKKHIERLEQILRALNNETLQFEQVDAIKDDFQDYLANHEEDDTGAYTDVDSTYLDLLDVLDSVEVHVPIIMEKPVPKPEPKGKGKSDKEKEAEKEKAVAKERERERAAAQAARAQMVKAPSVPAVPESVGDELRSNGRLAPLQVPQSMMSPVLLSPQPLVRAAVEKAPPPPPPRDITKLPAVPSGGLPPGLPPGIMPQVQMSRTASEGGSSVSSMQTGKTMGPPGGSAMGGSTMGGSIMGGSTMGASGTVNSPQSHSAWAGARDMQDDSKRSSMSGHTASVHSGLPDLGAFMPPPINAQSLAPAPMPEPPQATMAGNGDTLSAAHPQTNLDILNACVAFGHAQPSVHDSVWNPYVCARRGPRPLNPPPYYPRVAPASLDNPALYENIAEVEDLFAAFYLTPGTNYQCCAARELKRRNWRYHKQLGAWFQRHNDPRENGEDFETGDYIYFDYKINNDEGWVYRMKSQFVFRYEHLESELAP